ncbi:acyl carrier protein [Campylobacter pinnipediorum]|uniref:Acyl carrier protein n=1 Tax=Campylobacter pinnipediorum subsp. pinnipediorum TaxID=1660067 RepID=A0AAX0L8H5_9BACT|nr:acyl carrier protein [Campylobacter pinnipediorum]AQW83676.1 formyltransferase domain-containing protein [Campylobacter pinnipediorum subsp. pinnipediorum]OPA75838.1 acyl carrier protein [Campylobacter pinnipediorum subsp. pinnipediorum]
MEKIKNLFVKIDRSDINENMKNLITDGHIDSFDIVMLVNEIEALYKKPLSADFIDESNFESFESIQNMLKIAYGA